MDTTLRRLLAAIGEPLVEVAAAPSGLDVPLTGLAIAWTSRSPGSRSSTPTTNRTATPGSWCWSSGYAGGPRRPRCAPRPGGERLPWR
jgi:hypothetical protein